jgi:hypothetical protein
MIRRCSAAVNELAAGAERAAVLNRVAAVLLDLVALHAGDNALGVVARDPLDQVPVVADLDLLPVAGPAAEGHLLGHRSSGGGEHSPWR